MSVWNKPGVANGCVGVLLAFGGSIGFLISDAPAWAKWIVPIVWGFYIIHGAEAEFRHHRAERRANDF